ncbi:unnamed protein product [Penicillium egyptiacum]|uniref:ATP-grasp domain-containing protein n=1 Tax=Penicillium egyptiacum TaxID=1303716 RepID=A0A9W4P1I0_9EURO|nr:unnamed protein product [Penicillium egyptiacum]
MAPFTEQCKPHLGPGSIIDSDPRKYRHAEIILNAGYSQVRLPVQYCVSVTCHWYRTIDVLLEGNPHTFLPGLCLASTEEQHAFVCEKGPDGTVTQYYQISAANPAIALVRLAASRSNTQSGLKFILPVNSGYLRRADILEERFRGCDQVECVNGFAVSTGQRLNPCNEVWWLSDILLSACGGIIVRAPQTGTTIYSVLKQVESEIRRRLSFQWLSSEPVRRKRLAVVQARKEYHTIERFYMAAKSLNINLIAVDSPGHWLEADDGPSASMREEFIPFDMTVDETFSSRLYQALKDRNLDGIITSNDRHLVGVAEAAEMLGLPTMPSEGLKVATDKYATRAAEEADTPVPASFRVQSIEELDDLVTRPNAPALTFPLIVKPCLGWSSDCVTRVTTIGELRDAVHRASVRHLGSISTSTGVVIEPYIDGPEVDTNIILLDGECLFFEISDDFPCTGDAPDANAQTSNFQETQIMYPTALPEAEQMTLRDSIRNSLIRLGLNTGVFHVEARVRNSVANYATDESGLFDLRVGSDQSDLQAEQPNCWLIEINSRPPGGFSDWATAYIHGVCYHAQAILAAVGDKERFKALATPFQQHGAATACPEPQFHCMLVYLSPERSGTLANSPCEDTLAHAPDLMKHVLRSRCWYQRGEKVSGPQDPSLGWLATYLVFARGEDCRREETLHLGDRVRKEFRMEID